MNQRPPPSPAATLWMIWFSLLSGFCMIQFIIGGGLPTGSDHGTAPLSLVGVVVLVTFVSLAIRFLILPKRQDIQQQFICMIVGLTLAESCGFTGMLMLRTEFPQTKLWIFVTAVTCMLLHAPIYAKPPASGSGGYSK